MSICAAPPLLCQSTSSQVMSQEMRSTKMTPSLMGRRTSGPHQQTCSSRRSPPSLGHLLTPPGPLLAHLTHTHPLHTHAYPLLIHLHPFLPTGTLVMRVRQVWTAHPALNLIQMLVQALVDLDSLECMAWGDEEEGDVLEGAGGHTVPPLHHLAEDVDMDMDVAVAVDVVVDVDVDVEDSCPQLYQGVAE